MVFTDGNKRCLRLAWSNIKPLIIVSFKWHLGQNGEKTLTFERD